MLSLSLQCAQENRLNRSQVETLSNLFPVREGYFPDPVVFLAGFGIVLNRFSWAQFDRLRDTHPQYPLVGGDSFLLSATSGPKAAVSKIASN